MERGTFVETDNPTKQSPGIWSVILGDVHFWVPAIILLAGLAVLHWIR
jgi:hypothetical protein